MSFIRVTYLEPCRVASFHVTDSLTPEEEAHSLFLVWAESKGLLPEHRFIPLIGFNNPWGPLGEKRGYELWCVLDDPGVRPAPDTPDLLSTMMSGSIRPACTTGARARIAPVG